MSGSTFCLWKVTVSVGHALSVPHVLFEKNLEFVSGVSRLLAAEYAGLPSQGHAVTSRTDLLYTGPNNVASRLLGSEFES